MTRWLELNAGQHTALLVWTAHWNSSSNHTASRTSTVDRQHPCCPCSGICEHVTSRAADPALPIFHGFDRTPSSAFQVSRHSVLRLAKEKLLGLDKAPSSALQMSRQAALRRHGKGEEIFTLCHHVSKQLHTMCVESDTHEDYQGWRCYTLPVHWFGFPLWTLTIFYLLFQHTIGNFETYFSRMRYSAIVGSMAIHQGQKWITTLHRSTDTFNTTLCTYICAVALRIFEFLVFSLDVMYRANTTIILQKGLHEGHIFTLFFCVWSIVTKQHILSSYSSHSYYAALLVEWSVYLWLLNHLILCMLLTMLPVSGSLWFVAVISDSFVPEHAQRQLGCLSVVLAPTTPNLPLDFLS